MNFSTLFRIEENLNLDKNTLVTLRWIANIGQFIAINLVYFYLDFLFPFIASIAIISFGIITNLYLQFFIRSVQLKDFYAARFLSLDLLQLFLLLYLTGGISNPFSILIIIPTIVSSTFLSMGTTIILGILTLIFLFMLTTFHYPLPGIHESNFTFPTYFLIGYFIAIVIGLIFLSYFGIRFTGETKKRSDASVKMQQIIAREYELESLGGQAAAAAHSLGTPLTTISVVAKELRKEIGEESRHTKDLDLLVSQSRKCGDILKKISQKKILEDKFISSVKLEDLLEEIIKSFEETSEKKIELICKDDQNKIYIQRSPEVVYGLRNFLGNAVKFASQNVNIFLKSDTKKIEIRIDDDGPGFAEDIIKYIGEPYIKSKEVNPNSGTGLGTFLGKTFLERKGAKLNFTNEGRLKGASVSITWNTSDLEERN
tara:strand:+ start:1063 stop:2346 length:1284 start_codon:yes stop_codon:yes gene_type:complete